MTANEIETLHFLLMKMDRTMNDRCILNDGKFIRAANEVRACYWDMKNNRWIGLNNDAAQEKFPCML